jgi:signal transduction histidine kinase/DNA-binding NarL/FixJ family response regulator
MMPSVWRYWVIPALFLVLASFANLAAEELEVKDLGTLEYLRVLAHSWEVEYPDEGGRREILETGSRVGSGAGDGTLRFRQRSLVHFDPNFRYVGGFVLKIQPADSFRLIVNGTDLGEHSGEGIANPDRSRNYITLDLPRTLIRFKGDPNEFVLEVTDSARDAAVLDVLVVRENGLANFSSPERINFLNGQLFTFFSLFMAYYTLVYFLARRREVFYLYFTLANLFFAIYFYRMAMQPLFFPPLLSFKISKAVLPLGVSFYALAFIKFYRLYDRRELHILFTCVGAALFAVILILPRSDGEAYRLFARSMIIVLPMVLFILFITIQAFRSKNPDARIVLIGTGLAVACGTHDLVFVLMQTIEPLRAWYFAPVMWLQGIGIFIFNLTIFSALAMRTMRARTELERYTAKVEDLVAERTSELDSAMAEATAANRAKSDFLANVSHEMRTPLNAIMGFGEVLFESLSVREEKQYARMVVEESQRLTELIEQLLDLSKIEAERLDLVEDLYDLPELLRSLERLLGSKAVNKGLDLHVELDENLPRTVLGDGLRLRQVLINLVDNGIKFTREGSVTLAARRASEEVENPQVEFRVIDTGIGIEQRHLGMLFNKFYQVDQGRTRSAGGFGLGTAISRLIVEKMGGSIQVESTPGEGTVFTVQVRLNERPQTAPLETPQIPGSASSENSLSGFRVLVVDDYPTNRMMVEYHLGTAGCTVESAEDGQTAVERATREEFDMILMDISMPEMDGCEATRRIRAAGGRMPIVALTANAYNQEFASYWEAGMNDILIKPFRKAELIDMVSRSRPGGQESSEAASRIRREELLRKEDAVLDYEQLLADFDRDSGTLRDIIGGFLMDAEERIPLIQKGILSGDDITVHRESHAIKGGAYNIRAERLAAAAERLEQKARAGIVDSSFPQFEELMRELHSLRNSIVSRSELI